MGSPAVLFLYCVWSGLYVSGQVQSETLACCPSVQRFAQNHVGFGCLYLLLVRWALLSWRLLLRWVGGGDGVPVELGGDDCGEDSCGIANVGGGGGGKLI